MKHKVGDTVFVKAMVADTMLDIDGGIERYMFECSGFWSQDGDIVEPLLPVLWRDGTGEYPDVGQEVYIKDGNNLIYKKCSEGGIDHWVGKLWIPKNELPEIIRGKSYLHVCPSCKRHCKISTYKIGYYGGEYNYCVECSCGYSGPKVKTMKGAVEKHQELCKNLKEE